MRILDSLAYDYTQTGYFSEALAMSNRMIEIDPLSPTGYGRKANALYALGRDEEAQTSLQSSIDLGNDGDGLWFLATDLLIAGEDEQAITVLENIFPEFGLDPSTVRSLVENARDPDTGKEYLVNFVNDAKAEARNFVDIVNAQLWYQVFGYMDELWREIEETTAKSQSSWSDADVLEHSCRVFAASGCASHPRAIVYAQEQGLTDLWDKRGPPDRCSKDSGEWVCE
jgi:tetratricopeptide (TPR) repeat protein